MSIRLETTEPIPGISASLESEYIQCFVTLEGEELGMIELPACDGFMPSRVLGDAIAAEFAWQILERFFERAVYPDLRVESQSTGLSIWRGTLPLAEGLAENEFSLWPAVHDILGWGVFLQEIWGKPDWPQAWFYNVETTEDEARRLRVKDGFLTVEASADLPDIETNSEELDILMTLGGVALGVVVVPIHGGLLRAQQLRAALTTACGFELCRATVREALIGRGMGDSLSLRARLAEAAAQTARFPDWLAMPGSARALSGSLVADMNCVVLGRRYPYSFGTSASRWSVLPVGAAEEVVAAAAMSGEPVLRVPPPGVTPSRVIYAPDLIPRPYWHVRVNAKILKASPPESGPGYAWSYDRSHFETMFARQVDPWFYTSPYEQTKYEQTLGLLPEIRFEHALEVGCAEGHFTVKLAPHVESLIAADISEIALKRAAERCVELQNIQFLQLDLIRDALPGKFDLIVCSEVLYYVGQVEALRTVAHKLGEALTPGGYLVTAHQNLVVDEPDKPGFDYDKPFGAKVITETLSSIASLNLLKEIRTPLYRIGLYRCVTNVEMPSSDQISELIEMPQPTALRSELEAHVLWQGGEHERVAWSPNIATYELPILMYHRVAPEGSSALARWRVPPEAFEAQLRYLRDAGYHSVRLEDWQAAVEAKRPLPGHSVILTFDDGYLDFLTDAWPLLKRYGFSATVFLVAEAIGGTNQWDGEYGEEVPLLGWQEIHQLQEEGVVFGSHSLDHPSLLGQSFAEVVRQGVGARAALERGLGRPVTAFAYPFGKEDRIIEHLMGACGYIFGLTSQASLAKFSDSLLALPRIEVSGGGDLEQFITRLAGFEDQ